MVWREGFILVSICTFVAFKFVALRLSAPSLCDLIFAGVALATAKLVSPNIENIWNPRDKSFGILCAIICFILLLAIYLPSGDILPVHDPIQVPTIAKIISEGRS